MHLLREVLSERVVIIEREMAFGSEGPFCSKVRGVHVVTCGPSQPLGRVIILRWHHATKQAFEGPGPCQQAPAMHEGHDSDV